MINRREFLIQSSHVTAGAAFLSKTGCTHSNEQIKRPNILFLLSDQHRHFSMGYAGDPQAITPGFDQLARQGLQFERALSAYPVCSPNRATLQTGRYTHNHGVVRNGLKLEPEITTIGDVLKEQGYQTGYIGKWHLYNKEFVPPGPYRHGYDFWVVHNSGHYYWEGPYYRDKPVLLYYNRWEPDAQTDLAMKFIRNASQKPDPFCLFLSWGTPHNTHYVKDEYLAPDGTNPRLFESPKTYAEMHPLADFKFRKNVAPVPDGVPRDIKWKLLKSHLPHYYGTITNLDDNLTKILNLLDQLDLADDTIVVYTSDHGEMLLSHGMMYKNKPFEESIRVPLLIRYPRRLQHYKVERIFNSVHLMPTLLGLAGISVPDQVDGTDYSEYLLNKKQLPDVSSEYLVAYWGANLLTMGMFTWRGIRTQQYTYAFDKNGPWVLFDNDKDPFQFNNLINNPKNNALQKACHAELTQWVDRIDEQNLQSFLNKG